MYLLNGTPISLDAQFESNGVRYPAGWIRSATPQERADVGITEEPDPPMPEQVMPSPPPGDATK